MARAPHTTRPGSSALSPVAGRTSPSPKGRLTLMAAPSDNRTAPNGPRAVRVRLALAWSKDAEKSAPDGPVGERSASAARLRRVKLHRGDRREGGG